MNEDWSFQAPKRMQEKSIVIETARLLNLIKV